jgi:hypothetical protein
MTNTSNANFANGPVLINSPNVELIRVNDGASRALHEACLRKTSDPVIGYAGSFSRRNICVVEPDFGAS